MGQYGRPNLALAGLLVSFQICAFLPHKTHWTCSNNTMMLNEARFSNTWPNSPGQCQNVGLETSMALKVEQLCAYIYFKATNCGKTLFEFNNVTTVRLK